MKLTEQRKQKILEMIENIPQEKWDKLEEDIKKAQTKQCDIPVVSSSYQWLKDAKYAWIQGSVGFPVKVEIISVNEKDKSVSIRTDHQCGDVGFDRLYKTEMSCPCR